MEKHDGGKRGGTTEEEREFITLPPCYASSPRLLDKLRAVVVFEVAMNSSHHVLVHGSAKIV